MRPTHRPRSLVLFAAALAACASDGERRSATAPKAVAARNAETGAPKQDSNELAGRFVPAEPMGAEELTLWPEAYKGELVLTGVVPQGSPVTAGQVLAELDPRAIDRELADAEFELRAAEVAHAGLVEKQTLEEEAGAAALARAHAGLERARTALEGFQTHERDFALRGDELARARERHWVEDQEDELEQLQMMYEADELTDATEDLVLKRTRRDLDLTRQRNALSEDQRTYTENYGRRKTRAEREEAVAKQTLELAHLERNQALAAETRDVARQRSARELEKKRAALARLQRDRERFTLRAPSAGVFLHGDPDDYRPGSVPAALEPGAKLTPRKPMGHVAAPRPGAVAVELDAETAARLSSGAAVTVTAAGREDARPLEGRLEFEPYPSAGKAGPVWRGRVALEAAAEGLHTGMAAKVHLGDAK